eukprot:scaffold82880_cov44-Prasinocladus_malaysianus.AAC.2
MMISYKKEYWPSVIKSMDRFKEGSLEWNACKYEQQKFDLVIKSTEEHDHDSASVMLTRGL